MTTVPKLADIDLPGDGYPNLINFFAPQFPEGAASLVGAFGLGGTAELSAYNLANPDLVAALQGNPAAGNQGLTLNPNAYIDTKLLSTADMTIMTVAKPLLPTNNATSQFMVANWQNGATPSGDSVGFYFSGSTPTLRVNGSPGSGATSSTVALTGADVTKWNGFAGRFKANGQVRAYWQHDGILDPSVESAASTRALVPRTLLIGREYSNLVTASIQEAAVYIFNAALADAQIAANFAYLDAQFAELFGINTL